jgi:hypothetical protein
VHATVFRLADSPAVSSSLSFLMGLSQVHTYNFFDLSHDEWTLMTIVRSNSTDPTSICLGFNDESYDEPGVAGTDFPQCLNDPAKPLFEAFEYNFDMLVSPIILVPWALTKSDAQKYYVSRSLSLSLSP